MQTLRRQIRMLNLLPASIICISFTTVNYCISSCSFESFPGTSIASLRLEIAKEEGALLTETGTDQPHEMTPALLIQNGLDLEEQQYVDYVCCYACLTAH